MGLVNASDTLRQSERLRQSSGNRSSSSLLQQARNNQHEPLEQSRRLSNNRSSRQFQANVDDDDGEEAVARYGKHKLGYVLQESGSNSRSQSKSRLHSVAESTESGANFKNRDLVG